MKQIIKLIFISIFLSLGVLAGPPQFSDAFIISVKTDNTGTSADNQFTIPTNSSVYTYDYHVDCGQTGTLDAVNQTGNYTCTFPSGDNSLARLILIYGEFPHFYLNNEGDKEKLISVEQWGTQQWESMEKSFYGAYNLEYIGNTPPDLSQVTSIGSAFYYCSSLNTGASDINNWDVSNVTTMFGVFTAAHTFNQDIGDWNVSKVTNMSAMFSRTGAFNQNISNWNVSKVNQMSSMFAGASAFNQDIGDWNVSKVNNMSFMFSNSGIFNQNINAWDVSSVESMRYMFLNAKKFNQDIGNWNVSKVSNMQGIFFSADNFSQDLGDWNISGVTSMEEAFKDTNLSINDYDNMLNSWNKIPLKVNVTLGMEGQQYCLGDDAKTNIISEYTWTISDSGINCDFYIDSPHYITVQSGQSEVGTITVHGDESDIVYGYLLSGDVAKFSMEGLTGKLSFTSPPDVENPTDSNQDNIYKIRVFAFNQSTSEITAMQTVRVKVVPRNTSLVPIVSYLLF